MYAYITLRNLSSYPVITIYINDTLYFRDVISDSNCKACPTGSVKITVLDNREKIIFDLYLPVKPLSSYILEVYTDMCIFIQHDSS